MKSTKIELSRDDFLAAVDMLSAPGEAAAPAIGGAEAAQLYGERMRMAREWKGFTLEEVALKTGVSRERLARAEAGLDMLPLGSLVRVAKTLSLRLADIISRGRAPFTIVRAGEGRPLKRTDGEAGGVGYRYESLAPNKKGKTMEPFLVTLFPEESLSASTHEGQEFLYVLEGEVEVVLEGRANRLLPGDAIFYDSVDNHLVQAVGDRPARIVAVISS